MKRIVESLHDCVGLGYDKIGIIAPYRAQIATLEEKMQKDVYINTVDKFQGEFSYFYIN